MFFRKDSESVGVTEMFLRHQAVLSTVGVEVKISVVKLTLPPWSQVDLFFDFPVGFIVFD